jgi:uncharacterized protein YqgV (UPF0045/DUF77 family)
MSTISFQERQNKIDQLEQKINVLSDGNCADHSELLFETLKRIELKVNEQNEKIIHQMNKMKTDFETREQEQSEKLLKLEEYMKQQQISSDERNDKLDDLLDKVEDRNDKLFDLLEKVDDRNDKIDDLLEKSKI